MNEPLLLCESARIALGGHVLCDELTLTLDAERVALIGDWTPLFELLGGPARLCAGQVRIAGSEPKKAAREGILGVARLDPELVPRWRFVDYLVQSGRLAGMSKADAQRASEDVLRQLGLHMLRTKPLERLARVERRVLVIAHAVLTDPAVVALEAPLCRLDEPARAWLGAVMHRALQGRRWLMSFPALPEPGAEGEALHQATWAVMVSGASVVAEGSPARVLALARRYLVRVGRDADRLNRALTEAGLSVTMSSLAERPLDIQAALCTTFTVDFAADRPAQAQIDRILQAACELEVPVLELRPLGRGATAS